MTWFATRGLAYLRGVGGLGRWWRRLTSGGRGVLLRQVQLRVEGPAVAGDVSNDGWRVPRDDGEDPILAVNPPRRREIQRLVSQGTDKAHPLARGVRVSPRRIHLHGLFFVGRPSSGRKGGLHLMGRPSSGWKGGRHHVVGDVVGGGGDVDWGGVDPLLRGVEVDIDVGHRACPPGRR